MQTTLDIDDDVLAAVKELAAAQGLTAGRLASDMLRRGLTGAAASQASGFAPAGIGEEQQAMFDTAEHSTRIKPKAGWLVLPSRGGLVTNELVARLEDDLDQEDCHSALTARRQHTGRAE